ncbi:hypothetical protein E2C01_046216 [Portunus trituberculatus]|uniref:Uncharacterized protein n=1 Tax=Portunus trituberculatus TaxID=210409 RepID=A0A5B7G470_PORTR|nr:hypothetical protein [Portunus trituberculatus]
MKLSLASLLALLLLAAALGTRPSQADSTPVKGDAGLRNKLDIAEEMDCDRSFGPRQGHVLYRRAKGLGTGNPVTDRPRGKPITEKRDPSFIPFRNRRRNARRG